MGRGFDLIPQQHRPDLSERTSIRGQDAVAREILDLASHRILSARLDGKRPILGQIRAQIYIEDRPDIVRRLSLTAGDVELIRILDFDNRYGFTHFSMTVNPTIPDTKVMPMLQKLRSAFRAAVRMLEDREDEIVANAVDDFLNVGMNVPDPDCHAEPRDQTPEIEDMRYRLTDLRSGQIVL